MYQGAEANAARVLGEDRMQKQDIGHDFEPVLVEVVLGGPHRVVPEGIAVLGISEEVGIDPLVVGLTVVPPVCRRSVNAGVRHVHSPVEEGAEMHHSLQSLSEGACKRRCLLHGTHCPRALPNRSTTPGGAERARRCLRYCATTPSRMHLATALGCPATHAHPGNRRASRCGADARDAGGSERDVREPPEASTPAAGGVPR